MSKHTPGPWELRISGIHSHDRFLCSVSGPSLSDDRLDGESWLAMRKRTESARAAAEQEGIATARLIAAAPELLDALKKLMDLESHGRIMPIGAEWNAARAAIAKAEGAL